MSNMNLEFRGAITGPDGSTTDHVATVQEPRESPGTQEWFCTVCCPSLMPQDEKISGATAAQALRLARLFVLDLLDRHSVKIAATDREH